jgi:hypothetical protein
MAVGVIAKNLKTQEIETFSTIDKCARHFEIQKGRLKSLMLSRKEYKGWSFAIKG